MRGVPRLPLREAQRVEGLGNARLRGVPCGAGATHGVVRMPAAARGRAAARGLTDESRLARRGASGAARAGPASVVPGAPPAVPHSAVRVRLAAAHGRWSLYGMRGAWVEGGQVRAARARSSLAAEGALPRASARRSALERHERALQKGEGWDSRDRALGSFFKELQTSTTTLLVWVGARGPSRGQPPPFARLEGAPPPQTPMAARDETDPNREAVGSAWRSSERSSVSLADAHLRLTACTTSVQRRGCLFFFVALVL